jgi:hypothetical protein
MSDLRVGSNERVVLSPGSEQFREYYQQVRPRTAREVRDILGLSDETAKAPREQRTFRKRPAEPLAAVSVEALYSEDQRVRARALHDTSNALEHYVFDMKREVLDPDMEVAIERYLEISDVVLSIVHLPDIVEVGAGGTLEIYNTHLVQGKQILIHGDGKIICAGVLKVDVDSIIGD